MKGRGARATSAVARWVLAFLVGLLACAADAEETIATEDAVLEGTLVDRDSGRPIGGVEVALPSLGRRTRTDPAGRFVFPALPAGRHSIVISGTGIDPTEGEEDLRAHERRTTRYLVSRSLGGSARATPPRYETVVRSTRTAEPAEIRVGRDEAQRTAGSLGDPIKILESLPGIARPSLGAAPLIIWGAAPQDTRLFIDDLEVPRLFHLGSFRSTLNPMLVGDLRLAGGGFGAAYGRSLGGLVRIETRELPTEGVHGSVGADLLDASAFLTAALGKQAQIAIAGRYGYLDRLAARALSQEARAFVPISRYDDYQLKASLRVSSAASLALLFLAADDELRRALDSADPSSVRSDARTLRSYRVGLRYLHDLDGGARLRVAPMFGFDRDRSTGQIGASSTSSQSDQYRYGLRASYERVLGRRLALSIGLDLDGRSARVSRFAAPTVPGREGDPIVFGQAPSSQAAAERYRTSQLDVAPYVSAEISVGSLRITPGLRAGVLLLEGDRSLPQKGDTPVLGFLRFEWFAEPRLALAWRAHPRLSLSAAGGLYHQAPSVDDLGPVLGNPSLGLQRGVHATASATVRVTDTLTMSIDGYYRHLDRLVARSPLPSPAIGQSLVQSGRGSAFGGQLLVRQVVWRGLQGWVSYSLSRSERRDRPDAPRRLSDYDQTHQLMLVGSYEVRGWSLGVRLRYSSGFPRTPVIGAFYNAHDDRYEPRFGAINTMRMPAFFSLDLHVEKTITWQRVAWTLYLDLQNVTNRRNAEEIVYNEDFSERGYLVGLPTLAVAGTRVSF